MNSYYFSKLFKKFQNFTIYTKKIQNKFSFTKLKNEQATISCGYTLFATQYLVFFCVFCITI